MSGAWMIQQPVIAYTPAVLVQTIPITTTTTYIYQIGPSPPPPLPQVQVLVSDVARSSSQRLLLCSNSGNNRPKKDKKGVKCALSTLLSSVVATLLVISLGIDLVLRPPSRVS
ncbi:hypothetical protein EDB83DRAFT_2320653 [Lactarius deliciosus]|nr:hypothetical protein EDB83DRAFT_2320653 [Lactarius deliciosus]